MYRKLAWSSACFAGRQVYFITLICMRLPFCFVFNWIWVSVMSQVCKVLWSRYDACSGSLDAQTVEQSVSFSLLQLSDGLRRTTLLACFWNKQQYQEFCRYLRISSKTRRLCFQCATRSQSEMYHSEWKSRRFHFSVRWSDNYWYFFVYLILYSLAPQSCMIIDVRRGLLHLFKLHFYTPCA